jgi:hypothetical protein
MALNGSYQVQVVVVVVVVVGWSTSAMLRTVYYKPMNNRNDIMLYNFSTSDDDCS